MTHAVILDFEERFSPDDQYFLSKSKQALYVQLLRAILNPDSKYETCEVNVSENFYQICEANDFFVFFPPEQKTKMILYSRYHTTNTCEALSGLGRWLAYRWGVQFSEGTI